MRESPKVKLYALIFFELEEVFNASFGYKDASASCWKVFKVGASTCLVNEQKQEKDRALMPSVMCCFMMWFSYVLCTFFLLFLFVFLLAQGRGESCSQS